jgi:hypothetical protein
MKKEQEVKLEDINFEDCSIKENTDKIKNIITDE